MNNILLIDLSNRFINIYYFLIEKHEIICFNEKMIDNRQSLDQILQIINSQQIDLDQNDFKDRIEYMLIEIKKKIDEDVSFDIFFIVQSSLDLKFKQILNETNSLLFVKNVHTIFDYEFYTLCYINLENMQIDKKYILYQNIENVENIIIFSKKNETIEIIDHKVEKEIIFFEVEKLSETIKDILKPHLILIDDIDYLFVNIDQTVKSKFEKKLAYELNLSFEKIKKTITSLSALYPKFFDHKAYLKQFSKNSTVQILDFDSYSKNLKSYYQSLIPFGVSLPHRYKKVYTFQNQVVQIHLLKKSISDQKETYIKTFEITPKKTNISKYSTYTVNADFLLDENEILHVVYTTDQPENYSIEEKKVKPIFDIPFKFNYDIQILPSLNDFYQKILKNEQVDLSKLILKVNHLLMNAIEFDSRNIIVLPNDLFSISDKVNIKIDSSTSIVDDLTILIDHAIESINHLINEAREKVIRNYQNMPIHSVREMDSNTIMWLSKRPGRNFREKLSSKPYVKALKRNMSLDNLENRLLKACLQRLIELIEYRYEAFHAIHLIDAKTNDIMDLAQKIRIWLKDDEILDIKPWQNLPPNNVLLQDKHYRKIWNIWLAIHAVDDRMINHQEQLFKNILNIIALSLIFDIKDISNFYLINQPAFIDYEKLEINLSSIEGLVYQENKIHKFFKMNINQKRGEIEIDFSKKKLRISNLDYFFKDHDVNQNVSIQVEINSKKNEFNIDDFSSLNNYIIAQLFDVSQIKKGKINQKININKEDIFINFENTLLNYRIANIKDDLSDFLFLEQFWKLDDTIFPLIIGNQKAINIHTDLNVVSLQHIIAPIKNEKKDVHLAMKDFARNIQKLFNVKHLTYLIPDLTNDFELETLRTGITYYFKDAISIPKSINTIFNFHKMQKQKIANNSLFLIVDYFNQNLSITPIMAEYQETLYKSIPESYGVTWERYPSESFKLSIKDKVIDFLKKQGCSFANRVFELFDLYSLCQLQSDLLIINEYPNEMFLLKKNYQDKFKNILKEEILLNQIDISRCIDHVITTFENRYKKQISILYHHLLPFDDFNTSLPTMYYSFNGFSLRGIDILNEWQNKVPNIPLWKDNLPSLSIELVNEGRKKFFPIVKNDKKVIPIKGKSIKIDVNDTFFLNENKKLYQFKLSQGDGNKELEYIIDLKSNKFPLPEKLECNLHLTYTYGIDMPYYLEFIPVDHKKSDYKIAARWLKKEDMTIKDLFAPTYPTSDSWEDLVKYPKLDQSGYNNLIEWVSDAFSYKISTIEKEKDALKNSLENRFSGRIKSIRQNKNGHYMIYVENPNHSYEDLIGYQTNTLLYLDFSKLSKNDLVFFDLNEEQRDHRDNPQLKNISLPLNPSEIEAIVNHQIQNQITSFFTLINKAKFPTITIWNQSKSISEKNEISKKLDIPVISFKKEADFFLKNKAIFDFYSINYNDKKYNVILPILFCMHKDSDIDLISSEIDNILNNPNILLNYPSLSQYIAYALGSLDIDWQKKHFQKIIEHLRKNLSDAITIKLLHIVSSFLWRTKEGIFNLSENDLSIVIEKTIFVFQRAINQNKLFQNNQIKVNKNITIILELILGLLRTRDSSSKEINQLFSNPNEEPSCTILDLLDQFCKKLEEHNIKEIKSRINMNLNKDKSLSNTPDIIYALQLFLTGDDEGSIMIKSIEQQTDDSE